MLLRTLTLPGPFVALAGVLLLTSQSASGELEAVTNGLGMTFHQVPAGTFTMGSTPDSPGHEPDELARRVTISRSFWLQTTPVTRAQWLSLVDGDPSAFPECGESCPVDGLRLEWIQWYIEQLSAQDPEWSYRLPTEAEWEYAARAGSTSSYHTGDCLGPEQANVSGLSVLPGCEPFPRSSGPQPVAGHPANAWGFHDMLGNTWEMCADWYGPYDLEQTVDPTGPGQGEYKVLRGGSWHFNATHARAANRFMARDDLAGFRLVAVPKNDNK